MTIDYDPCAWHEATSLAMTDCAACYHHWWSAARGRCPHVGCPACRGVISYCQMVGYNTTERRQRQGVVDDTIVVRPWLSAEDWADIQQNLVAWDRQTLNRFMAGKVTAWLEERARGIAPSTNGPDALARSASDLRWLVEEC